MIGASLVEHPLQTVALNMSIGTWLMHPMHPCTAGANASWFHLHRLLLPNHEAAQDRPHAESLSVAMEQFMQSSSLGEFQCRLDLLWSFR